MKIEKLELLLNKVVEFNQPDVAYYKGFLYKDSRGYYIKVVEGILGHFEINDKVRLNESDEQFIIQAEKPKLMRVSLKSWHYRLIKYVLADNAPTPKTMQNGCPYFWLLIFSLFASPFVFVVKAFWFLLLLVPRFLYWGLEKLVNSWINEVDDAQAYEYYWDNGNEFKMPITAKVFFDKKYDGDFIDYFINEKYGLNRTSNFEEYYKKRDELKSKWEEWRGEINELREKRRAERIAKEEELYHKRLEFERKRRESEEKWEARMKPIREGWQKFLDTFTFDPKNWKNLIKRTKQIVGAIITLALLVGTFYIVQGIVFVLTAFVDFSISHWHIYAFLGVLAVIISIIYVLYIFITGWVQTIVNKYHTGKKVWYIEPFIYLLYYPIKYLVLGIAYGSYYIIAIPLKYIFYNMIWKIILVNLGKLIWKGLTNLGHGIANSTGIFGEYFGASYSDYCPGIEWADVEEED